MRYLFGFMCVLALSVMGCGETAGTGGSGGDGGAGGDGGSGGATPECQSPEDCDDDNECTDDTCLAGVCEFMPVPDPTGPEEPGDPPGEGTTCGYYSGTCEGGSCVGTFACTEAGIREAIAAGAGPHTFDCDGPTTVETQDTIEIDNDVGLDGEGNLTVAGSSPDVFKVAGDVTAQLIRFELNGEPSSSLQEGIVNFGVLTMTDCTLSGYDQYAIRNGQGMFAEVFGSLTLTNSTVSGNGTGIYNGVDSQLVVTDSSVSENTGMGISNAGTLALTNSTVSGNTEEGIGNGAVAVVTNSTVSGNDPDIGNGGTLTVANSLIDGTCRVDGGAITSNGYNIESPGDTCGFDQTGDQVSVTAEQLNLGSLADNGGPTMTHALLTEPIVSVAIDVIPGDDCVDAAEGELLAADQRGEPRFVFVGPPFGSGEPVGDGCDVGSFEVQPEP